MKHRASVQLFELWETARGERPAPERAALPPESLRHLLPDVLIVAADETSRPIRFAGTRVCALFGADLKARAVETLVAPASRHDFRDLLDIVVAETIGAVAGLTGRSPDGSTQPFEMLLLPFLRRPHTPATMMVLLSPFAAFVPIHAGLTLTGWRHIATSMPAKPRKLQKTPILPGIIAYEGVRQSTPE